MTDERKLEQLANQVFIWAKELGFNQCGITDTRLETQQAYFDSWIKHGYQGEMDWIKDGRDLRFDPQKLHAGTLRILSFTMNYLPQDTNIVKTLKSSSKAYISRYALGRDYHKLMRKRLVKLSKKMESWCDAQNIEIGVDQRPFVDSAPVLERPIAEKAGIGWTGKHTLILNKQSGSWFFLGELFTNIPLPTNKNTVKNACHDCTACLKVCPTDAFPKPYVLDAKRCISYLTIENKTSIPVEFREPIGNRVFGCDDCQTICPWNKFAKSTDEKDFKPRHKLDDIELAELFEWDEKTFLKNTEGSAIRRIGFERWQRNLAVGLGNGPYSEKTLHSLNAALKTCSPMVAEHIHWAVNQIEKRRDNPKVRRLRKIKAKTVT